jgi:hypothetical protein
MTDLEQRLRDALDARAELVQPEDLGLNPVLEPTDQEVRAWWQHPSAYLFIAAVAVIVIALPLLALAATKPDAQKDPVAPATSPTNPETITDPAPIQVDRDKADIDGDGKLDEIRVVSSEKPAAVLPDFEVVVELSASGETVKFPAGQLSDLKLGATANLDGRPGEEILAALEPQYVDLHRAVPLVLSLHDGELVSILADKTVTSDASDGTRTHWWVHDGQLWWWRSKEPVAEGEQSPYAVDVLRFPRAAVLRGVGYGTRCVTSLAATELLPCGDPRPRNPPDRERGSTDGPGGTPETDTDEPAADPVDTWWQRTASGLPAAWAPEGGVSGALSADVDGNGEDDTVTLAAGQLRVDLGEDVLTAPIDGPSPSLEGALYLDGRADPVIVGHVTEGATATTYVTWFAFAVIGEDLVQLGTAPLGPSFASRFSSADPSAGGHPTVRTWRTEEGGLYGMDYLDRRQVEGPEGRTVWVYLVRVRSWYVDGTLLRATTLGQGCVAPALGNQYYDCPQGL